MIYQFANIGCFKKNALPIGIDHFHPLVSLFLCFYQIESICLLSGFDGEKQEEAGVSCGEGVLCMSHEPLPLKGTCQLFKFILATVPLHRSHKKSDLCVRRAAPLLGDHAGRWKLSLEVAQGLSGQALTGTPNPQLSHHRRPAAAASFTTHAAQYAPVSIFST